MEVFVDVNVLVDFLAAREKFVDSAAELFKLAEQKVIVLNIASVSYNHVYYILCRHIRENRKDNAGQHPVAEARKTANEAVGLLLQITKCLPVDRDVIRRAHESKFVDFEDAIQHYCALQNPTCEVLLTRNERDYKESAIPVMNPEHFLKTFFANNNKQSS